uniref:C-type lectin domain-containing protein n=1 Tax=Paramormyrops kingsleyae TaxID=1676925 RepID=A0A3B3RNL2_9TELE
SLNLLLCHIKGWTRHGSFCYQIGSEEKTFEDANQDCLRKDSHLINVANRFENAFLTSLVGMRPERYFWIGLSNKEQKETFVWTNSANVRFTHFGPGMPGTIHEQPNNYNGVELCGEIYSYNLKWNDRHCESLSSWICQIHKGTSPTLPRLLTSHCKSWRE